MNPIPNQFKAAIAAGRTQIGLWCTLCSATAVEVAADSGFDWLLIDTEHAPNDIDSVLAQLRAIGIAGRATPIVRPVANDPALFKRYLDIGAQSLLVPFVESAEDARRAVAATRYPPNGVRGVTGIGRASRYGRVPGYLGRASDDICVLVQAETRTALEHLEEIAAVDGVDGVFIGPQDLAASLGHLGNPAHAVVQDAIGSALQRLRTAQRPAGILTANEDEARRYLDWGATFVAVGIDLAILARGADALAKRFDR